MIGPDLRSRWTRFSTTFWKCVLVVFIVALLTAGAAYRLCREIQIWK